jgi:hypothetical protein
LTCTAHSPFLRVLSCFVDFDFDFDFITAQGAQGRNDMVSKPPPERAQGIPQRSDGGG